jgi:tRNA modification GTPase
MTSTIFALATPAGRSGVAIIRISGPQAGQALRLVTRAELPAPRVASLRKFYAVEATILSAIDDGLALWFPAPASFTGEDVAELQIHGGPAVIAAMLQALSDAGLSAAGPGDFTRRAFHNGKLDLTEVEGLADLIAAETEAQRRQALRQMEGEFGRRVEGWRQASLAALARIEAAIDFPDEDLPEGLAQSVDEAMRLVADEIARQLDDQHRGERLREGLSAVILGAPNAGKSSLLNRLARRDAAIVSAEAGTTRDVIELQLDLGGYPVVLADTAGLRESGNAIETEGVRRALARAARADLKIVVLDGAVWPEIPAASRAMIDDAAILVLNKADLKNAGPFLVEERAAIPVSTLTGAGLSELLSALQERCSQLLASGDQPALTRLRHREALQDCLQFLARGLDAEAAELKAEDLRLAGRALGRITGRFDVEDVLDLVFREFCIGK